MTSKRYLERRLAEKHDSLVKAHEEARAHKREAEELRWALEQVAHHYGFHEAYVREEHYLVEPLMSGYPGATGIRDAFSTATLISDLETIDNAAAADEARARLGITKEEA